MSLFGPLNLLFSTTLRTGYFGRLNLLQMQELQQANHIQMRKDLSDNPDIHEAFIKELYPNKINRIILISLLVLCAIEFILFVIKAFKKRRGYKLPLLLYLISKILLFSLMLFYNDFGLKYIIPAVRTTGETQLFNFGHRLILQMILHATIYIFISTIHTCLLLSVISPDMKMPKYFRLFITISWFFALLGTIKELFIYQIELKTRYYKYIHAIIYFNHAFLIFFYKYFLIKLTASVVWSILIGCICYLLSGLSYILYFEANLFTECFYPLIYLGSLTIGFPMWKRFLN